MVILRYKGRGVLSSNIPIKESLYDTMRTRNVLPLRPIKTFERYMKRRRTINITNTPCDDYGFSINPDASSGIYITALK